MSVELLSRLSYCHAQNSHFVLNAVNADTGLKITASIKFQTFAEQWFEEYAKINLRPTSFERMRQTTQRVYPALGHMKLDKITARHIQAFISDLYVNGKNQRNGKPLSRKTVVHHLNFISDIFAYAIKMDMLSDNPCRRVTVPKGESKEKEIYTIDEVKQIFQKLDSEPLKWKLYIMLAIYSGFRRSEMLGDYFALRKAANRLKESASTRRGKQ